MDSSAAPTASQRDREDSLIGVPTYFFGATRMPASSMILR